jgi:hypothetical protein
MFELLSSPEEDGRRILFLDDSNVIRRRVLEIWEDEVAGTFPRNQLQERHATRRGCFGEDATQERLEGPPFVTIESRGHLESLILGGLIRKGRRVNDNRIALKEMREIRVGSMTTFH